MSKKYVIVSKRSIESTMNKPEFVVNGIVANQSDQSRFVGEYSKAMRFDSLSEANVHLPKSGFEVFEDLGNGEISQI